MKLLGLLWTLHHDERGFIQGILPWLLGITALVNYGHRQQAAGTLEEEPITDEQAIGAGIQSFANRGLVVGAQSPAIQEMLRRKSLAKRQEKARMVLAGPDPLATLFGMFSSQ